jgi:hypothetical protein
MSFRTIALVLVSFACAVSAAVAQSRPPPPAPQPTTVPFSFPGTTGTGGGFFTWPWALSTTPTQILPANPLRRQLVFYNSSATASVAVCPAVNRRDSTPVTCAVNGAGGITLLPYQMQTVVENSGVTAGIGRGIPFGLPSAWNGVASSGGSSLTVLEFE